VSRLTVEMLPDVTRLPASSLCDSGLRLADGQTLKLYSAMDPALVDLQFGQMAASGVKAVALQRFVSWLADPVLKRRVDRVLANAMAAAQRQQLPLYITYDVSGAMKAPFWTSSGTTGRRCTSATTWRRTPATCVTAAVRCCSCGVSASRTGPASRRACAS